jgi:hypothetical protein
MTHYVHTTKQNIASIFLSKLNLQDDQIIGDLFKAMPLTLRAHFPISWRSAMRLSMKAHV